MDDLIRQAYERRERLRRELLAIDAYIAQYEKLSSPRDRTPENREFDFDVGQRNRSTRRKSDIAALINAAEEAIIEAGRPLTRSVLVRAIESRGMTVVGGDKSKVFGTNLWRSGRFLSLKKYGYWPLSRPLPEEYATAERRSSQVTRG